VQEYNYVKAIRDILQSAGGLSEHVIGGIIRDVLSGLAFLHEHNVTHKDIKAANVLFYPNGVCKLCKDTFVTQS
jgi:serine/threonine protein kinase